MKRTLLLFLLSITLLHALHIYEDTVWDRRSNPYIFEENVYIHSNATLTILPGCDIQMRARPAQNYQEFRVDSSGEAEVKIFYITGKIVAIGTEEEPITFTRYPDTEGYAWGGIYVDDIADTPVFQYCEIFSAYMNRFYDGTKTMGGICVRGCDFRIKYCTFTNCYVGVTYQNLPNDAMIYGNTFTANEEAQFSTSSTYYAIMGTSYPGYDLYPQIISARNRFINIDITYTSSYNGGGGGGGIYYGSITIIFILRNPMII